MCTKGGLCVFLNTSVWVIWVLFYLLEREMVGPLFLGGPRPPPARKKIYFSKKGRGRGRRGRDTVGGATQRRKQRGTGSTEFRGWV